MGYSFNPYSPVRLINSTILLEDPGELVATGLSIAGTTEAEHFEVPLFQTAYSASSGRLHWHDFYFPESLAPIEYWARNCDKIESGRVAMVRLECLLYELSKISGGAIRLVRFLEDLNEATGANGDSINDWQTTEIELVAPLEEAGYFVSYVHSHERELSVYFNRWIGGEILGQNRPHVFVEWITYRPTPLRKLNKARRHDLENFGLSRALWEDLNELGVDDARSFFTPRGEQQLLGFFNWTKLSMMTNSQARQARITHLQQKHDPDDSSTEIAQSLKEAELYSVNTSLSQIKKFLPGLLKEAFSSDL